MKTKIPITLFIMLLTTVLMYGQGNDFGWHVNPDSLQLKTVSGKVMVDSVSTMHQIYFLDTNNDKQPDYMLNFGPFWYEPDSSTAMRPNDGDSITVYGGDIGNTMMNYDMMMVYSINGEFWRDPYEPIWNNLDGFMNMGGHHNGDCGGNSFGWNHDSLTTITITGTALVDSTFIIEHYYLDENNDSVPDYMLNFGPPWYEPVSGAVRPTKGEQITIVGGKIEMPHYNMIVVYEINGKSWRDSSNLGFNFGGGWMNSNSTQPQEFHSTFDDSDLMVIHPGWHMGGGMHGGMMMPDSIFAQIFEVYPNNFPGIDNQNAFAGYQFNLMYPSGQQGMGSRFGCGGMMQFNNNMDFQLHYNDMQLNNNGIDKSTIKVKYFDSNTNSWVEMPNTVMNTTSNTITFSKNSVDNLIILTGESVATGISNENKDNAVKDFQLFQNYPNPFNPSTDIRFEIKENANVNLSVYNVLGQKVAELVNSELPAGIHSVSFNASNLSSGIYFYELKAGTFTSVRKMELLK